MYFVFQKLKSILHEKTNFSDDDLKLHIDGKSVDNIQETQVKHASYHYVQSGKQKKKAI